MPRNGRGGRRSGTPGATYSNRSDLAAAPREAGKQPVRARPSQAYGERADAEARQRAMPLPQAGAPAAAMAGGGAAPEPGALPGLTDPSAYPDQPVTAGLPIGPGAGPEALGMAQPEPGGVGLIRQLLAANPDEPELYALLDEATRAARKGMAPGAF